MADAFVDTSFVVALVNRNDQHHNRAAELSAVFEDRPLVTTDAVLLEVGNALAKRFKAQAVGIIGHFLTSGEVRVVHLDAALFGKAYSLDESYADKEWGMVDCVSFVVMREAGVTDALTSDKHFGQAGFNVLM